MSETKFVFSADAADLVKQSKSVAGAAKQMEAAHVAVAKAANAGAASQLRSLAQIAAEEKRLAAQMRKDRLDAAQRATRVLPGGAGRFAAGRLAGSSLSTGSIGSIGMAATALGGVAVAATAAIAAYKVFTAALSKNTELQAAADRAASSTVQGTANAEQEFVKNAGALAFLDKRRIVGLEIPQLQRELRIAGFDDFTRAVGAAISAGGSAPLAVDATRQAAMLYPFNSGAVEDAAPQLALIAKALGDNNARLAAGIVLKTNEYSPIKDIGQLAQALPSIFSATRRIGMSDSAFQGDAKFAADMFANIASETADRTGEETKTLLRTLIPLMNRFFSDRADVGSSLQDRFRRLTTNATDRDAFLGTKGLPGGSQADVIEKLFSAGSPLNTNVESTAATFNDLTGAVTEYHRQITELTATSKLAVQQQRMALEQEQRNRNPGAQARGTLRDIMDQAKAVAYSDQYKSIGKLQTSSFVFDSLLESNAFQYGSSEQINEQVQPALDRIITALQSGGVSALEKTNIETLQTLKDIANQTVAIDRESRVSTAIDNIDLAKLDAYEKSIPRGGSYGVDLARRDYEMQDRVNRRFGGEGGNVAAFEKRLEESNRIRNNMLNADIPADPIDRQIRLMEIAALDAYRTSQSALPGAVNAFGSNFNAGGVQALANVIGEAVAAAMRPVAESMNGAAKNLKTATTPKPSANNGINQNRSNNVPAR